MTYYMNHVNAPRKKVKTQHEKAEREREETERKQVILDFVFPKEP